MFLTLDIAKSLIKLIASLITYFWLIPLLGYFRAWTAKKMGDSTPEMLGFLTLDPFVHIDMIGLAVLCFLRAGWGVHIPIYLSNIDGRYASAKRLCALFSDTFMSFVVATSTVVIMVLLGYNFNQLVAAGNQPPSMIVAFYTLLLTTLHLSMFLMLINFVTNLASFIVWSVSRRTSFYNPQIQIFLMLGPLLIYILFGPYLYELFYLGVSYMSQLILRLFGM
jgi:hypothetical protein